MPFNQFTEDTDPYDRDMIIAKNLSELLKKHCLKTNQLAHHLGLPTMTIRRLLSGETGDPRISTLKCIADYFDVAVDVLIADRTSEADVDS